MTKTWSELAERVLDWQAIERKDALRILVADDTEVVDIPAAAFLVRRRFFGTRVKLNYLVNARSGNCSEDCAYCSQSAHAETGIAQHPLISQDEIVAAADRAVALRASTCCIVTSGGKPNEEEIEHVAAAARKIKRAIRT